jgi:hypothetical protein
MKYHTAALLLPNLERAFAAPGLEGIYIPSCSPRSLGPMQLPRNRLRVFFAVPYSRRFPSEDYRTSFSKLCADFELAGPPKIVTSWSNGH